MQLSRIRLPVRLGFTVIELLLVVAILGLLLSIALTMLAGVQDRANDAKRITMLKQMQVALRLYYNENNAYPSVGAWIGHCNYTGWTTNPAAYVLPALVPSYIQALPVDPQTNGLQDGCFMYYSNGTDYKLIAHWSSHSLYARYLEYLDPRRDGGPCTVGNEISCSIVDGTGAWAWAIYTPNAASW